MSSANWNLAAIWPQCVNHAKMSCYFFQSKYVLVLHKDANLLPKISSNSEQNIGQIQHKSKSFS